MSFGYPDGCTQAMHDAAFDGPPLDEVEYQQTGEELAERAWDERDASYVDFLKENASDYVERLVLGGDLHVAAVSDMRRDFVAVWIATHDDEIREAMQ